MVDNILLLAKESRFTDKFHEFSVSALHYIRYGVLATVIIYFIYKTVENFKLRDFNNMFLLTLKCFGIYISWLIFELISITYLV